MLPPRLVSASVCLLDIAAPGAPGSANPLGKPARSISQAADSFAPFSAG